MSKILKTAVVVLALSVGTMAWAQTPQENPQQAPGENEPITVTVVSVQADELVVRTENDEELHLTLSADAETPDRTLRAGDRIRVWREMDATMGDEVVMRVELADVTLADDPTTTEDTTDPLTQDPVEDPVADPVEDPVADPMDEDPIDDSTYESEYGEALPGTASNTPLAALLGIVAVGGALILRVAARSF